MAQLQVYASTGERYFAALQHYDDELMAWTRSLGTESEALRPDTWPIVEYLKRYPAPIGEYRNYSGLTAADVESFTTNLNGHVEAIPTPPSPNSVVDSTAYLDLDVGEVREMGRSIEYIESLHAEYNNLLVAYDAKVQALASNSNETTLSSGRITFATGINIVLGAVTLAGLAALFLPRRSGKREAPQ